MPPSGTVVPASDTLCRLLQVLAPAPQLGDEVGAEPDEVESALESPESPESPESSESSERAPPMPTEGAAPSCLNAWVDALADERRVLCAHAVCSGVRTLDRRLAGGHASWWIAALVHTHFSRRDSHLAHEAGGRARAWTYRRGGAPQCGFDWFPTGAHFGMPRGRIDALLHYGLLATITELRRDICVKPADTSSCADARDACASLLLHAEAASAGVAPALFAGFLLHEGGASSQPNSEAWNSAVHRDAAHRAPARRVAAHVAVSQVHTFTLTDMLRGYFAMGNEANKRAAREQVHLALGALRTQLDRASNAGLVKLNLGTDDVVFCPELTEASADEWELGGFGFRTEHISHVPGMPFLAHYSTQMCARWSNVAGVTKELVSLFMLTLAAEAMCARFGDAAAEFVNTLFAAEPTDALLASVAGEPEFGASALRAVLAQTALSAHIVDEVTSDWRTLTDGIASGRAALVARLADHNVPVYTRLVNTRAVARADRATRVSVAAALASRQRTRSDATGVAKCAP